MLDYSAIPDQKDHHHLGTRINIATRSAHTKLNKSLLLRLPLALPPKATTPSVYVTGLVHVAPIYIAFESKWRDIVNWEPTTDEEEVKTASIEQLLDDVSLDNENENSEGDDGRPKTSPHMHSILKHLHLPVLERSARLKADIRSITGWTEAETDEQIRQAAERGELGKFISHIKQSINEHPHVLLAYAWVLYMALFAGGRFIRGSLENAGAEFWDTTCEPVLPSKTPCNKPGPASPTSPQSISTIGYEGDDERSPAPRKSTDKLTETAEATSDQKPLSICNFGPLSFFRFAGPQDGEDLKVEFKKRLLDSESRFSTKELDDIVYEATHIFDYMNSLVAQLDAVFESSQPNISNDCGNGNSYVGSISRSLESWARLLVPGGAAAGPRSRHRDSVAIAKERGVRALAKRDHDSIGSQSSVASSEWSDDRNWPKSPGSPLSPVAAAGGAGVSDLHTKGTLTPAAELKSALHQKDLEDVSGIGRSKSVRFGKGVAQPGKKPAGLVRSKSHMERVVTPKDDDASSETSSMAMGGLDGADELVYESESGSSKLEASEKASHYGADRAGVCPAAGIAKPEKHVRFLITPSEEDKLRRKAAPSTSSKTVTVVKNGMVVLGLVSVLVGVGKFRV
ncbi:hypothetical protein V8F06_006764 [Rhypophila decipiens]